MITVPSAFLFRDINTLIHEVMERQRLHLTLSRNFNTLIYKIKKRSTTFLHINTPGSGSDALHDVSIRFHIVPHGTISQIKIQSLIGIHKDPTISTLRYLLQKAHFSLCQHSRHLGIIQTHMVKFLGQS